MNGLDREEDKSGSCRCAMMQDSHDDGHFAWYAVFWLLVLLKPSIL